MKHLDRPLGMESRSIHNEQITASSYYDKALPGTYPPSDGRLTNDDGYWATAEKNPSNQQWIQIDFLDSTMTGNDVIFTGIQTQGSGYQPFITDCWVTELQVQTGNTTEGLQFIYEEGTRFPKVNPLFIVGPDGKS